MRPSISVDLVEVTGNMGFSKNGTRSLVVRDWRMIGKCLRPLPNKWNGLTDPEARLRTRYVDLAVNNESRHLMAARSSVLRSVRETLFAKGFIEVETPILQQIHGGATARPFVTHINAYGLGPLPAHRTGALPEAVVRRRRGASVRTGAGPSATRVSTSATTPSSPCWRPTRRTPITRCGSTAVASLIQNAAEAANGTQTVMRPVPTVQPAGAVSGSKRSTSLVRGR